MRRDTPNTSRLFSTSGTFGAIQIVAAADSVAVDVQAQSYDAEGYLCRDHAAINMSLAAATRLRDTLSAALDQSNSAALDRRQTALWGEARWGNSTIRTAGDWKRLGLRARKAAAGGLALALLAFGAAPSRAAVAPFSTPALTAPAPDGEDCQAADAQADETQQQILKTEQAILAVLVKIQAIETLGRAQSDAAR